MNQAPTNPRVQLGCGSLILIAIIVLIFSGRGDTGTLQCKIEDLNQKIDRLEQKIDALTTELQHQRRSPQSHTLERDHPGPLSRQVSPRAVVPQNQVARSYLVEGISRDTCENR